jgi:hypothetical protein
MGRGFSSDVVVAMLTQLEYARNIRVLIFNYRKKPSLSQINLLTNTELGELLNELPIERKQIIRRVTAGVGWGKIAREWGTKIKIKNVQLEYQLACRYLCKRILDYSESLGFKNEKYLSKERVSFMRNKFSALSGDSLRGMPIEALGLSSKTYNTLAFKMNGIRTLTQIRMLDMYELSRIEGVGDKTIEELKYVLKVWK